MKKSKELEVAIKLARQANNILKKKFSRLGVENIKFKEHKSIVTSVDIEINKLLISKLHEAFPNDLIVSEEDHDIPGKNGKAWYIDPIDGTANFARGSKLFGVSIGMTKNEEVELGVIGLPMQKEIYFSQKGLGVFEKNKKIIPQPQNGARPLYLVGAASPRARQKLKDFINKSDMTTYNAQMYGCAVEHLTAVATGRASASIMMDIHPWDVVAGVAMVREAGGIVTNLWGETWTTQDKTIVAANKENWDKIIAVTKTITD